MTAKKITVAAIAVIILILGIGTIALTTHHSATPIAQATTSTPATRATTSSPIVTFPDGTAVEILAIRESTVPNDWWSVNGSSVPEPDIRVNFGITMKYSTARALELIVKLTGSELNRKGITIWGDLPLRTATQSTGNANKRLMKFIVPVPYDTPSGDLRIGLAGGKWEGELSLQCADGAEPPNGSTGADTQFLAMSEDDKGRTQLRLLHLQPDGLPIDRDIIVVAGGRELRPGIGVSLGDVYTHTFKCPRSEAQRIIIRSRPYEWIDLENVAFQPTTASATTQPAL